MYGIRAAAADCCPVGTDECGCVSACHFAGGCPDCAVVFVGCRALHYALVRRAALQGMSPVMHGAGIMLAVHQLYALRHVEVTCKGCEEGTWRLGIVSSLGTWKCCSIKDIETLKSMVAAAGDQLACPFNSPSCRAMPRHSWLCCNRGQGARSVLTCQLLA